MFDLIGGEEKDYITGEEIKKFMAKSLFPYISFMYLSMAILHHGDFHQQTSYIS